MNALLIFLKIFKYLAVIPQMNLLFATLATAGVELALFSLLFSVRTRPVDRAYGTACASSPK